MRPSLCSSAMFYCLMHGIGSYSMMLKAREKMEEGKVASLCMCLYPWNVSDYAGVDSGNEAISKTPTKEGT